MIDNFLRSAIRGEKIIALKYYPNKDGSSHRAWRFVEALYMFTRKSKRYVLCWQQKGTTGDGFRLFIVNNIQDWKSVDMGKALLMRPKMTYTEIEFLAMKMELKSQFE